MPEDKFHKCYIWHIITLAKMKLELRELKNFERKLYGNV